MKKIGVKVIATCLTFILIGASCAFAAMVEPEKDADALYAQYLESFTFERTLSELEEEIMRTLHQFSLDIEALGIAADSAVADGAAFDLQKVRNLEREEERLEDDLDRYEDMLEASYRAGDYDLAMYIVFETELERLDDVLDDIEDRLEHYWDGNDDD